MILPIADDNRARKTFPGVTYALIAINLAVFALELIYGDPFIEKWAFVPSRFLANPAGEFITIFSSMFMHAGWLHILGNMLYLFIFGDNVEDRFGHLRFLIFYLVCGLAATFTQLIFIHGSDVPNLGASGAIAGVLGAYILMFPLARVIVLLGIFPIPLPALVVIGFWIILQIFIGIGSISNAAQTGGVAYMAHVGGFFTGLILTPFFRIWRRRAG
jgi:membrane associated rhomboid family serine protease